MYCFEAETNVVPVKKSSIVRSKKRLAIGLGLTVISLVSTIALPVLACGPRERSEAQGKVTAMNRAQQAHYLKQKTFAKSLDELAINLQTKSNDYTYSIEGNDRVVINYGLAQEPQHRSHVGAVFLISAKEIDPSASATEMTTIAILCVADTRGTIRPSTPTYQNGDMSCGSGTSEIYRSAI